MSTANGWRRLPQPGNVGHRLSWTFKVPATTRTYYWSVQAVDGAFTGGPFAGEETFNRTLGVAGDLPRELSFALASANPAAGHVAFRLGLPAGARAQVGIYDLAGRRMATLLDGELPAGYRTVTWQRTGGAGGAPAGVYYARFAVAGRVFTRKVVTLE